MSLNSLVFKSGKYAGFIATGIYLPLEEGTIINILPEFSNALLGAYTVPSKFLDKLKPESV
jgi:hypothetical protein